MTAVFIGVIADPAANGQRHKYIAGSLPQYLKHRHIFQGKVSEARNVKKGNLIGAFLVVPSCQFNRLAQISDIAALPDIVLIALGDHQIPLIICAHIETGDDTLG